ncbi:MAG: LptA/OstA family protein [Candidatus Sericytochromatia bacterium]
MENQKKTRHNTFNPILYSKRIYLILFLYILLFIIIPINSFSQDYKSVDIDSDSFTFSINSSNMVFSGNVKIRMNNFYATCNKAEVYINQKTKKMEKLKMIGKAKINKDNSDISADKVIFEPNNDKLYIEGNVKTKIKLED